MKSSRFRYSYRNNASKLHKMVGDLLRNLFPNIEVYQEYPVVRVDKIYSESSHHFDWVIPQLKLVIECHGRQHYEPVAFDGNVDAAVASFHGLQARDKMKKEAALRAGFTYIEIPYTTRRLSDSDFYKLIELAKQEQKGYTDEVNNEETAKEHKKAQWAQAQKEKRRQYLRSDAHKEALEKARQHRKERYRRIKEQRDG